MRRYSWDFKKFVFQIIVFCAFMIFINLLDKFDKFSFAWVYVFIISSIVLSVVVYYKIIKRYAWHGVYSKLAINVLDKVSEFSWHHLLPEYAGHRLIRQWVNVYMKDGVIGTYDNRKVFFGSIQGTYVESTLGGYQNQGIPIRDLFVGIELKRFVPGSLIIQAGKMREMIPYSGVEVQFESVEFNKLLDVFAPSEKIAYQLVDPALMNMLLNEEVPLTYEFHGSYLLVRLWKKPNLHPTQLFEHILQVTCQLERNIGLSKKHDLPRVHIVRNFDSKNEEV